MKPSGNLIKKVGTTVLMKGCGKYHVVDLGVYRRFDDLKLAEIFFTSLVK